VPNNTDTVQNTTIQRPMTQYHHYPLVLYSTTITHLVAMLSVCFKPPCW